MTGQQDAIGETARQILGLPFQDDAASTTFGNYLSGLSVESGDRSLPMEPGQAKGFLEVLERLADDEPRLSRAQREDLRRGSEALLEEIERVNMRIEDFKIKANSSRGDVSYAAIERHRDEKGVLDGLFPDRPDPALNEGHRVEYLEMQRDWSKRSRDLVKLMDLMTGLLRRLGITIDPPGPTF